MKTSIYKLINKQTRYYCCYYIIVVQTTTQQRLYLSMCVYQQQVACSAALHPAEDVLTRGRAALSDQEVTAAGEQGLCLLSSQPGTQGSQRGHRH